MKVLAKLLRAALLVLSASPVLAQQFKGHIAHPAAAGRMLVLLQAVGESFHPVDSVRVSDDGAFAFASPFSATGFYQLVLNDTDRVNLVLDAREPLVDLHFAGLPLAEGVQVLASEENKRLWELHYVTEETKAVQVAVAQQRRSMLPTDTTHMKELDRIERRAADTQAQYLAQLMEHAGSSYFARMLQVDQRVQQARGRGPMAVAEACDLSDPELLRSTVYDKAVMAFLQNLNAVSEAQFANAADTLVRLASGHPACRAHMLELLVDLFATYGPESALQHVVDRYVAGLADTSSVSPRLRHKVEAPLRVSVGGFAPDVELHAGDAVQQLATLVGAERYTAVFFYSSTCDHCHAQMPALKHDFHQHRAAGFNVVAIALDVDSLDFLRTIQENRIPWKCYSEFNGWGSKAAQAFQVKATPTLFLLGSSMRIVAKPKDAEELGHILRGLLY